METRVLLREGSSIRENKFSYDKEVSMEKELFYEKENSSIIKRKFYYEKKALKGRGFLFPRKKLYCGKGNSIMRRTEHHGRENCIKEFFYEKETLY